MKFIKQILLFGQHTCPWWLAYSWDHRLRALLHDPKKIVLPYLREGDTAIDFGCGMGYFSFAMAKIVGSDGKVYAVDIQQKMLDILEKRSRKTTFHSNIVRVLSEEVDIYVAAPVDFILSFWMLHEVENKETFLHNVYSLLKDSGKYLLVEPKIHTSQNLFDEEMELCQQSGFRMAAQPEISISRSVLFTK